MNMSKAFAVVMLIIAGILAVLTIALLAFIPFAQEIEDALGPLAGGIISIVSAAALALDSREFLRIGFLPRVPKAFLHAINVVALLCICALVTPAILEDVVYDFETRVLICLGLTIAGAYIFTIGMRHADG